MSGRIPTGNTHNVKHDIMAHRSNPKTSAPKLTRQNVKHIEADAHDITEISFAVQQLSLADARVAKLTKDLDKTKTQVRTLTEKLRDIRDSGASKTHTKTFLSTKEKLFVFRSSTKDLELALKEAKNIRRDQKALTQAVQTKELVRQKAVTRFLKQWNKEYDQKTNMLAKRIAARKNIL